MSEQCMLCFSKSGVSVIAPSLRDSDFHKVVQCNDCGHVMLDMLPTLEEDRQFYNEDRQTRAVHLDMDWHKLKEKSLHDIQRRKLFLEPFVARDSLILEIGTGYGFFCEYMENSGFRMEGIEVSRLRREVAHSLCRGPIYDVNLLNDELMPELAERYDCIVLFHVLEHITEPVLFMSQIEKMLKPQGKVIIEVPNLNDHLLSFCEPYRRFYWQRAHVSYFTPQTLQFVLKESGFAPQIQLSGVQRYSLDNMMTWLTHGKPQIERPAYDAVSELQWLDDHYKQTLCHQLTCDTIIAVAGKN